jgi:MFS transporter, FHS family, L-fucose permease
MAVLQVAINPLLRVAGGEEHYAFNSTVAVGFWQRIFHQPANLFLSRVEPERTFAQSEFPVTYPAEVDPSRTAMGFHLLDFRCFLVGDSGHFVLFQLSKSSAHRRRARGSWEMYRSLARQRVVWLYFAAMFAYVGCEQGTADWMSSFLRQYHGLDPHTTGAAAVSWFWGCSRPVFWSGCYC